MYSQWVITKYINHFDHDNSCVLTIAYSPCGNYFLSGSRDLHTIKLIKINDLVDILAKKPSPLPDLRVR